MKIYNQDCLEAMKETPNNAFDICITSPPYNLGNKHHTGNNYFNPYKDNYKESDYQKKQIQVLNELYRIIKDDGSVFYNHKNRIKDGFQISPYEWLFKSKWKIKQEIVWVNRSQNFDKIRFYPFTERIYWLTKNKKTKFKNNINISDVNYWKPEGTKNKHKRAFPLQMVSDILKCFPKNLNVLDIYLGSATTAIACHNLDFNFTGYEIDKDYYEAALKRIEQHKAQKRLF
tara:strand:- start:44 stop:733 length:690 start_codon:yes stop_codon:yes gene_type:complete